MPICTRPLDKYNIYKSALGPSHEAYLQHGLGHSPNSSPSATLVCWVQQSTVAEYTWSGPDPSMTSESWIPGALTLHAG